MGPIKASPLTGWLTDSQGAEWVTLLALLLSIPWWCIIIIQSSLPLFIVAFAIESNSLYHSNTPNFPDAVFSQRSSRQELSLQ